MPDEQGFLAAIRENPDDDTPRLIYADWLDDRGDADRAEFIRVQCELAKYADRDARPSELVSREANLLACHEEEWLGPIWEYLPSRDEGIRFRRGLLDE